MPTRVKRVQVLKEDNLDNLSYAGSGVLPEIKEGKPLFFVNFYRHCQRLIVSKQRHLPKADEARSCR